MEKRIFILLLTATVALANRVNYDGSQLLRMELKTPAQLKFVQQLEKLDYGVDLWLEPSLVRPVDIFIPALQVDVVKMLLAAQGITFEVSMPDVGAVIAEQAETMNVKQEDEMNWFTYQRYDTIMIYLESLAAQYPDICKLEQYGVSGEGRPLNVMRIGRNSTAGKPAFFLDAGMHAREWIGPAIVTWMMKELVERQGDNEDILEEMDIYITPIANPDGYEFSHESNRMWRKTRSDHNSIVNCRGVDPNRNFEYEFGGPGTSIDKCSDIYHGPGPFSEPETRAMTDYIVNKLVDEEVNWVSYFAIHSYAQMWLVPWGWTYDLPPTYDELMDFGYIGANALSSVHGTQYQVGSVTELLSPGAGGSDDWAYGTDIFRYSQTVEVRDTGRFGFLLPPDQIIPTAQETWAAIQATARFIISQKAK